MINDDELTLVNGGTTSEINDFANVLFENSETIRNKYGIKIEKGSKGEYAALYFALKIMKVDIKFNRGSKLGNVYTDVNTGETITHEEFMERLNKLF